MKTLILSCNTGGGHNSAAKALKEYFESRSVSCDIRDALAYISKFSSDVISKGHVFMYKNMPKTFGIGYTYVEDHPTTDEMQNIINLVIKPSAHAIYNDIVKYGYDNVVCVHLFAAEMVTYIRENIKTDCKFYFCSTDYSRAPGMEHLNLDAYFISHSLQIDEFLETGQPREKLIPAGIPVSLSFYNHMEKHYAKSFLGLPINKKVIIMMGGSMGAGPIKKMTERLSELLPENAMLVVICGSNSKLQASLSPFAKENRVRIVGFTSQVSLYLDAAELIITKPGGLSTTEAATKHVPLLLQDAIRGLETHNLEFFLQYKMAETASTSELLCVLAANIINDEAKLAEMRQNMEKYYNNCTVKQIYDYLKGDLS